MKARRVISKETMITLYSALIRPYFSYCFVSCGNAFESHIKKLQTLQKKILRIVTFSEFRAHSAPLFTTTNIMTIKQLYHYFSGIHIYKCINNVSPISFWNDYTLTGTVRYPKNLKYVTHTNKGSAKCSQICQEGCT